MVIDLRSSVGVNEYTALVSGWSKVCLGIFWPPLQFVQEGWASRWFQDYSELVPEDGAWLFCIH